MNQLLALNVLLALFAWVPSSIGEWAIAIVIVAAIIAVVFVVIKQMGVTVPAWVVMLFWILVAAVVGVGAIRFLMQI